MTKGQQVGYIRVSSIDQNTERQLDGITLDKVYTDKLSGKDTNRPQFQELCRFVREGDRVIVHSMDRLARNLDDLRKTVQEFTQRGVEVQFIKENLIFTGDDSPMSNLLLSVMGAFAEFERSLIKERQREGIEIAKQKGLYTGRKKSLTEEQASSLVERALKGEKKSRLAEEYGISRDSVYEYLKRA